MVSPEGVVILPVEPLREAGGVACVTAVSSISTAGCLTSGCSTVCVCGSAVLAGGSAALAVVIIPLLVEVLDVFAEVL